MHNSEIQEGKSYQDGSPGTYFRTVEFLIEAPNRPGGILVVWHTNGFSVRNKIHRTHGKCGIDTFARWAKSELKQSG